MKCLLSIIAAFFCWSAFGQAPYELLLRLDWPAAAAGGGGSPNVESSGNTNRLAITGLHTNSVTCSGANRCLYFYAFFGDGSYPANNVVVSNLTYNGVALTKLWATNGPTWVRSECWRLVNPASGANNLIMEINTGFNVDQAIWGWKNVTNVNQTTPDDTVVTASGSSTTPSVTVSSATGDLVISGACGDSQNTLNVSGAGHGAVWRVLNVGSDIDGGCSTNAGAASVVMSWSQSPGDNWAIGGVSINPP